MTNLDFLNNLANYTDEKIISHCYQSSNLGLHIDKLKTSTKDFDEDELNSLIIKIYRDTLNEWIETKNDLRSYTWFILMKRITKSIDEKYKTNFSY